MQTDKKTGLGLGLGSLAGESLECSSALAGESLECSSALRVSASVCSLLTECGAILRRTMTLIPRTNRICKFFLKIVKTSMQVLKQEDLSLDKTISSLEMELAVARTEKSANLNGSPVLEKPDGQGPEVRQKVSSRKRRDSVRETWMPQGSKLKQLEEKKGIFIRFVIGHSDTPSGILDRAIDSEDAQHHDFLRLEHVEGYHELSLCITETGASPKLQ